MPLNWSTSYLSPTVMSSARYYPLYSPELCFTGLYVSVHLQYLKTTFVIAKMSTPKSDDAKLFKHVRNEADSTMLQVGL